MLRQTMQKVVPAALRAATSTSVAAPKAKGGFPATGLALRSFATVPTTTSTADDFSNKDGYFEKDRVPTGDPGKREFSYLMLGAGRFIYATTARFILLRFLGMWGIPADVLALAKAEFELGGIDEGTTMLVKWRGNPVYIKHRTKAQIDREVDVHPDDLRDPETDDERSLNPKYVLVIGICTHLGCVPNADVGDYDGWFCPCHGSHYDTCGRIRKGPAPLNMEIPPYKFISKETVVIG